MKRHWWKPQAPKLPEPPKKQNEEEVEVPPGQTKAAVLRGRSPIVREEVRVVPEYNPYDLG